VTAWQNAIRLDGENAVRQTGLGEAMVAMSGGMVSFEAQQAFPRALGLDGERTRRGGRTLWYARPVGTMPDMADVVVQLARGAGGRRASRRAAASLTDGERRVYRARP
jgi:hypothetical protein